MPDQEGFWIRIPAGEGVEIDEHCRFAGRHLDLFGLTPEEVEATGYGGETYGPIRERMLRLVMSKGWIRMRRHRDYIAFQFEWGEEAEAIAAIRAFIAGRGPLLWPTDRIVVTHVGKDLVYDGLSRGFLEASANDDR